MAVAATSRRYNFVAIIALHFSRSCGCAIIAISLLDTSSEVDERHRWATRSKPAPEANRSWEIYNARL